MKKGQNNLLSALLILVAMLLVFLIFFNDIGEAEASTRERRICEQSVDTHIKLKTDGENFEGEIVCPTRYHVIKEKDDEKVKLKLAGLMVDCWQQFKEGRADLFTGEHTFCLVCDHIVFEDQKRAPIKKFPLYLYEEPIPKKHMTYANYFHNYGGDSDYVVDEIKNQGEAIHNQMLILDPKKEYSTIFTYVKGKSELEKFAIKASGWGEGAVLNVVGFGLIKAGAVMSGSVIGAAIGVPTMIVGGLTVIAGTMWGAVKGIFVKAEPQWAAFIELTEYNSEEIKKRGCQYLPARGD